MAITAPRYTPSGVSVGSMPVPQVRPATGAAGSLAAVGDTIASLGKSAEYAQQKTYDRAQHAEALARAEAQNKLTKVRGLYLDWEAQAEANHDKAVGSMVGAQSIPQLQTYGELLKSEDLTKYTKDLDPVELQEFDRLVDRRKITLSSAATQRAMAENKRYSIDVNTEMATRNMTSAATNLAAGNPAMAASYLQTARESTSVVADQRGMAPADKAAMLQDTEAAAYNTALSITAKESPRQAINFYEQNKGKFGRFSDDAQKAVLPLYDAVSVDTHAEAYSGMRDKSGNLTAESMAKVMSGSVKVPGSLALDEQRRLKLQTRLEGMLADDVAQRKVVGNQVLGNLDALMMEAGGQSKAQSWAAQNTAAVERMVPEDRIALARKLMAGPTVTDVPAYQTLKAKLEASFTAEEIDKVAAESGKEVLSASDREAFISATQKMKSALGTKEGKVREDVKKMWETKYERNIPSYRDQDAKTPLTAGEIGDIRRFQAISLQVNQILARTKEPSLQDVERAFNAATAEFKMSDGKGGVTTAPYATVPAADRQAALKSMAQETRRQAAANRIATMRESEGLGPDPGTPSTLDFLFGSLGELSRERNDRLGFTP